jgi:predicted cupin superfamily sugar epimerase
MSPGAALDARRIIAHLKLEPHPEGGHYRETWRHEAPEGARGSGTAIYYLLQRGERSHWHRVDATEIWHWYAGAPLALLTSPEGSGTLRNILGPDLSSGGVPQIVVEPHLWQSAESLGDWTLAGCTVSPAFKFAGFQLAPPDWTPRN